VFYNGQVGYSSKISDALDEVFGAGAGAGATQVPGGSPPPDAAGAPPPSATASNPAAVAAATAIQNAFTQLKSAQQSGDFKAQGDALAALDAAVKQFQAAQGATTGG
jgi:uncharacterized protein